jgi:hypothetical protein
MQDKPTPGPWVVTEPSDTDPYDDISIKAGPRTVCRIWQEGRTGSPINAEQWANARLIASAPDLLMALKALRLAVYRAHTKEFGDSELTWESRVPVGFIRDADVAIAQATGQDA